MAAASARFTLPAAPARARRATPCRATASGAGGKPAEKKQPGWTDKATVAGGGFTGACDIEARARARQPRRGGDAGRRQAACRKSSWG
jgi:hypothetical protein